MLDIYHKKIKDGQFQKIEEYKSGCWIHISKATKDDLEELTKVTNLNIDDLIDSLDELEIPRIERQDNNILIYIRIPNISGMDLYTSTLTIVLTEEYIITISQNSGNLVDTFFKNSNNFATTQKAKMLLHLLLTTASDYTRRIKRVRAQVSKQKVTAKNVSAKEITDLTDAEEILSQYISALVPFRNVVETILTGNYIKLYEEDNDLLQDLYISIKQSVDVCNVNLNSIRNLRDSYQIIFTNYLNKEIKLLTTLTILLTIPTMVFSFYGMNISLPFDHHTHASLVVALIVALITGGIFMIFKYKKWL